MKHTHIHTQWIDQEDCYNWFKIEHSHRVPSCLLRYAGQSEWFRSDSSGKFSWDFVNQKDSLLEEVDLGHTVINQMGLGNLGNKHLLSLIYNTIFLLCSSSGNNFFMWILISSLSAVSGHANICSLCAVVHQWGTLCALCRYEAAMKWTTGPWPGFMCSRTLWRSWTSPAVRTSQ